MHYYLAFVVTVSKHGSRSAPQPYTIRAQTPWDAEDLLRDELGEGKYEISIATTIGYESE